MKSIAKMGWVISMTPMLNICKIMTEGVLELVAFTKATVRCAQGVMRELETYEVPQCTETWDASLLASLHHLGIADVI